MSRRAQCSLAGKIDTRRSHAAGAADPDVCGRSTLRAYACLQGSAGLYGLACFGSVRKLRRFLCAHGEVASIGAVSRGVELLPKITVVRPRPFWQWLAIRLGPILLAVIVFSAVFAGKGHAAAALLLGLLVAGVVAVILPAKALLISRLAERRQRQLLSESPPGTLFAGSVSQVGVLAGAVSGPLSAREGMRPGRLRLDRTGLSFASAPSRREPFKTDINWQLVSELRLTPSPGRAGGRLTVITADGQTVYWLVPALAVLPG